MLQSAEGRFLPLPTAASIANVPACDRIDSGPVVIERLPPDHSETALTVAHHLLFDQPRISGSITTPDSYWMGSFSTLAQALEAIMSDREVYLRRDPRPTNLPIQATTTLQHAYHLQLLDMERIDRSTHASAWLPVLLFLAGNNVDIVKNRRRSADVTHPFISALYPYQLAMSSSDTDGYLTRFRHEGRIYIWHYDVLHNRHTGGVNWIFVEPASDAHNEVSTGRQTQVRPLEHNDRGVPGFYTNPAFYDNDNAPSRLLLQSSDPAMRLVWFARELRRHLRKPSHCVDLTSHQLSTLAYHPHAIPHHHSTRITANVFAAMFEDVDRVQTIMAAHGLAGKVFGQNRTIAVLASLRQAEKVIFADTAPRPLQLFAGLSDRWLASLLAYSLPVPLDVFLHQPKVRDQVMESHWIGDRQGDRAWTSHQSARALHALETLKQLSPT